MKKNDTGILGQLFKKEKSVLDQLKIIKLNEKKRA